MFDLHNERSEAKKGDLLSVCVCVCVCVCWSRERGRERGCVSELVCIQGDWSEVVWVVWWWFGANMVGLRNKNACKFLQVFILSQKNISGC